MFKWGELLLLLAVVATVSHCLGMTGGGGWWCVAGDKFYSFTCLDGWSWSDKFLFCPRGWERERGLQHVVVVQFAFHRLLECRRKAGCINTLLMGCDLALNQFSSRWSSSRLSIYLRSYWIKSHIPSAQSHQSQSRATKRAAFSVRRRRWWHYVISRGKECLIFAFWPNTAIQ